MIKASNHWGIELIGVEEDKKVWCMLLKPPFDPYVEEVKDDRGDYLALRSTTFDEAVSAKIARQLGETMFKTLNVAISKHTDADPVGVGSVIEFVSDCQPRKHRVLKAEGGEFRMRGGFVDLGPVLDQQGAVVELPPTPSQVQLWMHAAKCNTAIGNAIRHLDGNSNWVELYKAWEELKQFPSAGISNNEISRFTQTANAVDRHRLGKVSLPKKPMELWEGRALITQWISAAIDDVLEKTP